MGDASDKSDDTATRAKSQTFSETIEVAGTQVLDEIKRLLQEGNIRRIKISAKDSDFHLEMPMTVGVLVGGAVVLGAPWLAILGVIGGLISKVSIEVERVVPEKDAEPSEPGES